MVAESFPLPSAPNSARVTCLHRATRLPVGVRGDFCRSGCEEVHRLDIVVNPALVSIVLSAFLTRFFGGAHCVGMCGS